MQFSRQPMLQFGTFDRDKAIWDALVLLSPVTQADLCDYLYQEYGYERLTTAINYLKPLSQYYHNGVYSVDYQHIPEWRIEPLQNALTADFYFVDEIKKLYISLFRDADENDIRISVEISEKTKNISAMSGWQNRRGSVKEESKSPEDTY